MIVAPRCARELSPKRLEELGIYVVQSTRTLLVHQGGAVATGYISRLFSRVRKGTGSQVEVISTKEARASSEFEESMKLLYLARPS